MIGFHRRSDGEACRNGVNWTIDKCSAPIVVIKLGKLYVYFRRRSDLIFNGADFERPAKRYIWGVDWDGSRMGSIKLDFLRRGIEVNGVFLSQEFLEDVVLPVFRKDLT